jgi:hypothetical protein
MGSLSTFDTSGKQPEKFYHALILGMFVSLTKDYAIKSNRESGLGRYDVMIIPHDRQKPGIVIEFKKVSAFRKETLQKAVNAALKQIEEKQYATELAGMSIKQVIKLGIAFQGKKVLVKEGKALFMSSRP